MVRTFQNVKADTAQLVDVGVEDLGQEADLGRDHGVVVGEEELELEVAAWRSRRETGQQGDTEILQGRGLGWHVRVPGRAVCTFVW